MSGEHKIGFVDLEAWAGSQHRTCETERHDGLGLPAAVVIALAPLRADGSMDGEAGHVWGACIECFGLIDRDMTGDWRLPGTYSRDGY